MTCQINDDALEAAIDYSGNCQINDDALEAAIDETYSANEDALEAAIDFLILH